MAKDSRGSSGSSTSSGRKRRSPTIDLSAEEVKRGPGQATAGAGEPREARKADAPRPEEPVAPPQPPEATDAAPAGSTAQTSRSPGRQEPRPKPEQPIPSAFALPPRAGATDGQQPGSEPRSGRGRAGWGISLVAAALAGGLIALAGLFLLDRAGVLSLASGTEETEPLRQRAAQLEQQLSAARQAAELTREDLQNQLADLNERVAQLADAPPAEAPAADTALDEEVARLQAALSELREQVGGASPPQALEDVNARLQQVEDLAERVAGLAERVESLQAAPGEGQGQNQAQLQDLARQVSQLQAGLQQLQNAAPSGQDLSRLADDLAGMRDQLAQVQNQVSGLQQQLQGAASAQRLGELEAQLGQVSQQAEQAGSLVPAVAAQALASALESGRPFTSELSAVRALGMDDQALSELEPYAETGLPSIAALRRRFQDLMPQLVQSDELPPPDAGPLERLWQSAQQIVEVRPAGPQEGGSPAAIASRIEAALQAANLQRALEEWQALPPDAQASSQDWAADVRAVVTGQSVAERLRSHALAQLAPGN